VNIEQEPFDSRLLADLKAGTDSDELIARVVDHYRMTKRQARDFLSFMTLGPDQLDEEPGVRRQAARW
jgi:hypothetical protein